MVKSILKRLRLADKPLTNQIQVFAQKPQKTLFYLNPGSQQTLFIEALESVAVSSRRFCYPDGEDGSAVAISPRPLENAAGRHFLYRAGNGTGKSAMGAHFCATRSELYGHLPGAAGLISANDYGQLEQSTLVQLAKYCREYGVPLEPLRGTDEETAKSIARNRLCWIHRIPHLVLSTQRFLGETEKATQGGRGFTIGWAWLDEWLRVPNESAFTTLLTRTRLKGMNPHTLITSTINTDNPYNWGYSFYDDPDRSEEKKLLFVSVAGSTYENRHNLAPDYIPSLKATLTPEVFKIEVLGEYAQIRTGKIFSYFDIGKHVKSGLSIDCSLPIHVSLDFNWNPATGIVAQLQPDKSIQIVHEFYLKNSNTFALSQAIADYLATLPRLSAIVLHGDATGNAKSANSLYTNWQIAHGTLREKGYYWTSNVNAANPSIQESINVVNSFFFQDRLVLNATCKELRKDLETLTYTKQGDIDKRTDPMRSHLADCLRYLVFDLADRGFYSNKARQVRG